MRLFIMLALFLPLLSGCLTDGIEDTSKGIKASVDSTNQKIEDTKNGQALGEALILLTDTTRSPNMRAAAAETVFLKGADDRIGKYLGVPGPIAMTDLPYSSAGVKVQIPNVTYIGEKIRPDLGIAPINADLYSIVSYSASSVLEQMLLLSKKPSASAEELELLRGAIDRMAYVSTAVLGAVEVSTFEKGLKELLVARSSNTSSSADLTAITNRWLWSLRESTTPERRTRALRAAKVLEELGRNLSLTEEQLQRIRVLCELRLGVK